MWSWIVENWELIFGVLGVIGLVVSILAWIQQRQPKQLDWELDSDIQLVSPKAQDLRDKLDLIYDGLTVSDPRVVVIRILNTGKKAVSRQDFVDGDPITITYDGPPPIDMQVVDASAGLAGDIAQMNKDFMVVMTETFEGIEIVPRLLNPGEWFDVQLLSEGSDADIEVTARFADRHKPMRRLDREGPHQQRRRQLASLATGLVGLGVGFLGAFTLLTDDSIAISVGRRTTVSTLLLIGFALFTVGFAIRWVKRLRAD